MGGSEEENSYFLPLPFFNVKLLEWYRIILILLYPIVYPGERMTKKSYLNICLFLVS